MGAKKRSGSKPILPTCKTMEKIWLKSYSAGVPAKIDVSALRLIASYLDEAVALYADRDAFVSGSTGVSITLPREIDFLAGLPKSNVGKILRRELRDRA